MVTNFSSESCRQSPTDQLDLQLLHDAQVYVRCLRAHQIPSAGQLQAFHSLYETYGPVIRRCIRACGVPAIQRDDCCQEVWKDIFIKLPSFHSDGRQRGLCAWVKTIAHSKATNALRYQVRHSSKHLGPQAGAALPSRECDPVDDYERHCLQEAVWGVLATLGEEVSAINFQILWMRAIEQRSVHEIAGQLHLTPAQVRYRCCRTKHKFRCLWEHMLLTRGEHLSLESQR
jgi:RNA polymerase sigma factor (sigma-70 family)